MPCDVVIVIFGAAVHPGGRPSATLRWRVDVALALAGRFQAPLLLPTGGVGRYGPSEASVMATRLRAAGVPMDRIMLEETGTDTLSSARARGFARLSWWQQAYWWLRELLAVPYDVVLALLVHGRGQGIVSR